MSLLPMEKPSTLLVRRIPTKDSQYTSRASKQAAVQQAELDKSRLERELASANSELQRLRDEASKRRVGNSDLGAVPEEDLSAEGTPPRPKIDGSKRAVALGAEIAAREKQRADQQERRAKQAELDLLAERTLRETQYTKRERRGSVA